MTTINNNAQFNDDFDATDLEISCKFVRFWDVGREVIAGVWIRDDGEILEFLDETTIEDENELALNDFDFALDADFAFEF